MTLARRPSKTARIMSLLLGLALALVLGELIATCALGGAYPTLNLYEPDARFGVVLTPDAQTRVVSPDGVVTDIRTNRAGFRGAPWPPPATGERPIRDRILIVGDSQVMGWGVPESDTFASLLGAHGYEVLAAGVPTWGPLEYVGALEELLPRYRPERVLYVVNAANDWREAPEPNPHRTTARDGWARVPLGADDDGIDFPLRRFLLGRSHLVLAVRLLVDPPASNALPPMLATRFIRDVPAHLVPDPPHRSRITRHVLAARALAERHGADLVPVLLPLDIQVHPGEWRKYRVPPRDARPTLALAHALAADVVDLVDLLPALVRASPGAFLPDDYHLSALGHAAVAEALRDRLARRATDPQEAQK